MSELNRELMDNELESVSGGKGQTKAKVNKKDKFDEAWKSLGMDKKEISGMMRAELYDEWERSGADDAKAFLVGKC